MTSVHLSPGNLRTLMKKFSFLLKEHFLLWNIMWNIPILPWAFLTFASKSWRPLLEGQYIIIHSWTLTVLKIQIEENMKQSNLKKAPPLREGPNNVMFREIGLILTSPIGKLISCGKKWNVFSYPVPWLVSNRFSTFFSGRNGSVKFLIFTQIGTKCIPVF